LLAGRKLLLADDSVTIQKVIELTFADEGVRVVTYGDGQEAIDKLEEVAPDIVLADVFMPSKSGYDVCEYVKQNEKLKNVPVVLLVGSFEPFDEAEARRVGADDILTKPFQSIRRLIDRVGALVSNPPSEEKEVPTAELPKAEEEAAEDQLRLNTGELEISTADTMPLPEELRATLEIPQPVLAQQTEVGEKTMDSGTTWVNPPAEDSDVLLDLGEFETASTQDEDEFVLELDDEAPKFIGDYSAPVPARAFVEPQVTEAVASAVAANGFSYQQEVSAPVYSAPEEVAYEDQVHEIVPDEQTSFAVEPVAPVSTPVATPSVATSVTPGTLSQEQIDAIARRVVEMMSDKVVQEIAWEVVPELAELMIKRQLEQKESQHQ
jgi:CheY-like chemotaxis protein